MANLNRVTVMGILGRDPETKQFPNGGSVATSEFWKDKTTGERKEATEGHRITTSNRLQASFTEPIGGLLTFWDIA